jgi:hypothetical protein
MKQKASFVATLIFVMVVCGCAIKMHPKVEAKHLPDNTVIKIKTNHPVVVKNVSTDQEEKLWCQIRAYHHFGKLYDVSEATLGIVKDGLLRNKILLSENANKILELSVDAISCEGGAYTEATITSTLRVRTGNGKEKIFKGVDNTKFIANLTPPIEVSLVHCVEQMLNDKDIIDYLEQ